MSKRVVVDWSNVVSQLKRYRQTQDALLGREVFGFLEPQLRRMAPRTLEKSQVDHIVQNILIGLYSGAVIKENEDICRPKAWLCERLKWREIDFWRKEPSAEAQEFPETIASDELPIDERLLNQEREQQIDAAIKQLEVPSRVVFRLFCAPERMEAVELEWLSEQTGLDVVIVGKKAIEADGDAYECSLLVDPPKEGVNESKGSARRRRTERFRKRRARVRKKFREIMLKSGAER